MEVVNQSSKLVAQAVEGLKAELRDDLPEEWNHKLTLKEIIATLEQALEILSKPL